MSKEVWDKIKEAVSMARSSDCECDGGPAECAPCRRWSEVQAAMVRYQITGGGETGKHSGVAPRKGLHRADALCRFKSCPPDHRKEKENNAEG